MDSCGDVACVRGRVDLALDRALNMSTIPLTEGVTLVRSGPPEPPGQLARTDQDVLSKFIHLVTSRNINIELANVNGKTIMVVKSNGKISNLSTNWFYTAESNVNI